MDTKILLLGSCFAENIGERMTYHKFLAEINPTGICYNPVSLAENVRRAINTKLISANELINNGEKYIHFDFHGSLGHYNSLDCLNGINNSLIQLNQTIRTADVIFITLGSAIVYEHIKNKKIVSNCHKFPQEIFKKRQLSIEEVSTSIDFIIQDILHVNPEVEIILTVSPVRHSRHGLVENSRSKANLISAVHSNTDDNDKVHYFPSFEILIDDLRDYRFYGKDLVHPSDEAIDYIWSYLLEQCMSVETLPDLKSIKSLMDTYHHKALNSSPEKKIQYLKTLKEKMILHAYKERFVTEVSEIEDRLLSMSQV